MFSFKAATTTLAANGSHFAYASLPLYVKVGCNYSIFLMGRVFFAGGAGVDTVLYSVH